MNFFRNFVSWTCLYFVGTCVFLAANVFAVFSVINADSLKQTLKEENIYSSIVPSVLTSTSKQQAPGELPLGEPWVRDIADKAFPAADFEQKSGVLIDSTFNWLDGKTANPEYTIDFNPNKEQLKVEIGNYLENRLASLPACSLSNLPKTNDPFTIECLPPGVAPATVATLFEQQLAQDKFFSGQAVLTSGDTKVNPNGTVQINNPLQPLENTRSWYQHKDLLMWLLPSLIVILSALGIFLASNRRLALRRLARSFLLSAVSLFIFGIVVGFVAKNILANTVASADVITRDLLAPVLSSLAVQTQQVYFIFAGVSVVVAVILFVVQRRMGGKSTVSNAQHFS